MAKKSKSERKWYFKLRDKYRLVVMNNETYEERLSFRLSRLNVFLLTVVTAITLITLTIFIIAFTPIREFIPGYLDVNIPGQLYRLEQRADSLDKALKSKDIYLQNIRNIIEGKEIIDTIIPEQASNVNYDSITIESESKTITPLLDRSIEKGSKTILKHSMRFGGKEYVRWIDDAYMLIGKSYFYKQDYFSARRSFNFVIREYENNSIKYDAMLWLARTYIEMEQFEKSEPLLNLIQSEMNEEANISSTVHRDFPFVNADQFIKQGNYNYAIDYLYDGISAPGIMVSIISFPSMIFLMFCK